VSDPASPGLDEALYEAHLRHGHLTLGRGDWDLSYAMFAEALRLKPNDQASLDGQKQVVLSKNWAKMESTWSSDADASIAALEEILRIDSSYRDARQKLYAQLVGKAEQLLAANDRATAFPILLRALEVNPNGPESRRFLATYTPTPAPTPPALSLEDAAAAVKRYTVLVQTDQGAGSGISLGGGRVLTAYHVVEDAAEIRVRFASGRQEPVQLATMDRRRDLALLRSSFAGEPAAMIRDVATLRQAEVLIAVGYPYSDIIGARDVTVTRGIFSGRWQSPDGVWYV
jgi:S1-C subfamily serine protease